MAATAVALPTFIHDDVPTQSLVDELRRLEEQRTQIQVAHRHRASDDTALMLQYYRMELDEVGFILRDRLWALILGRGEDANDARVQGFFTALTTQGQAELQAEAEATGPDVHINELDEADIAALAAWGYGFDNEPSINHNTIRVSAPVNPVAAFTPLPQQRAVPPPANPPIIFPALVTSTPLEIEEAHDAIPTAIEHEPPCPICMEDISQEASTFHDCGHQYHADCLRDWLLNTISEKRLPLCTQCSDPVPSLAQLQSLDLPAPEIVRIQAEYAELSIPLGQRVHCPSTSCGAFLGSVDGPSRMCGRCNVGVCTKCRETIQGTIAGHVCGSNEEEAVLRLAKDSGWQRCYSCHSLVERTEGCPHIVCRCTREFCYLCGMQWKTCPC